MRKSLFVLVLLLQIGLANAGYSVNLTTTTNTNFFTTKNWTGCYLTVAMAIYQAVGSGSGPYTMVDSIDMTAGTWHAYISYSQASQASGSVVTCVVQASGGNQVQLTGSVNDPGLTGGGVSGSGGSSYGMDGVNQWSVQSLLYPAVLVFSFCFGFLSGFRP